jgi:hypothetical protein
VTNGAFSLVVLAKPTDLSAVKTFLSLEGGTAELATLADGGSNLLASYTDANSASALANVTASAWQLLAITKAAGTVQPRFHRTVLGAASWTHVTTTGESFPNIATTVTVARLGAMRSFGSVAGWKATRMATAAVFGTELSDANVESIDTTHTTQKLVDLGALAVWDLNQASTATSVTDLVGSANQSSITGTTVATGDDPTWTFGLAAGGGSSTGVNRTLLGVG